MARKIAGLGFETTSTLVEFLSIKSRASLSEYDILIIQPAFLNLYEKEYYDYKGKPYLKANDSSKFIEDMVYWRQEIITFLSFGKTIFILSSEKKEFYYQTGKTMVAGLGKHSKEKNIVNLTSNYRFLEFIQISNTTLKITQHTGAQVIKEKNTEILSEFYEIFKDKFNYQVHFEHEDLKPVLRTKHSHIVGGIFELKGALILLPSIKLDQQSSNILVDQLLKIDKFVKLKTTPIPDWAIENYKTNQEDTIYQKLCDIDTKIKEFEDERIQQQVLLKSEQEYRGLLFETGKPLEEIVKKSLRVLGYTTENFTDKVGNEIDIILISPEGNTYCGECEGKESKAIDINKFRQLSDHIEVYEESLNDDTTIHGVLFGNAARLKEIKEREEDFTKTCIDRAKHKNIILIKTSDLYPLVQYLRETDDEDFKKICRDTIHNSLGQIVQFPSIPK